jgi:hydroxymethylpyrimidine pyrophosphatase-like HAD family hydrolase
MNEAIGYLHTHSNIPKRAIVFDIDDTLLVSNTNNIIIEVYTLYRFALTHGYTIFIVTNRIDNGTKYTAKQLQRHNITYKSLYLQNQRSILNPYIYKELCRKNIESDGYHVVVSVGDMPWDGGKYGGKFFQVSDSKIHE